MHAWICVVLVAFKLTSAKEPDQGSGIENPKTRSPDVYPTNQRELHVQVPLGGTAYLRCPVPIGEDIQVSWIRRRDFRILASGRTSYFNDKRFRVYHADHSGEWTLQIKYVLLTESELYECQVSTATGILTYSYNVTVLVPRATIVGGGEYHVDRGSTIKLVCIIDNVVETPQFVFWYHDNRMVNYDSVHDGRIHVSTATLHHGDQVVSQLTISHATDSDSGFFTCSPSNAPSASATVYLSEGDEAAAIQVDSHGTSFRTASTYTILGVFVQLLLSLLLSYRH